VRTLAYNWGRKFWNIRLRGLPILPRQFPNFTSPTILSVIILLLIAFTKSKNLSESVEWVAIILLFFVFMPVVYVLVRSSRSGKQTKSLVELNKFFEAAPRGYFNSSFLTRSSLPYNFMVFWSTSDTDFHYCSFACRFNCDILIQSIL